MRSFFAAIAATLLALLSVQAAAQDITIDPGQAATPPSGNGYVDPISGWSLQYDDDEWEVMSDEDSLIQSNGVSIMTLVTVPDDGGPSGCLADAAGSLTREPGNQNVAPATDDDGEPVRGEDAEKRQAYAVYLLTREGTAYAVYLDCRTVVEGQAMLLIMQLVEADDFNDENEPRQELLDGIRMPTDTCADLDAFVERARDRLDQRGQIITDLINSSMGVAQYRVAAGEIDNLIDEQESASVPPGAEEAHVLLLELLELEQEALNLTADSVEELNEGIISGELPYLDMAPELIELGQEVSETLDDLEEQCGSGASEQTTDPEDGAVDETASYTCPPDQMRIDSWREEAEGMRELAEGMDPLSTGPVLILADQWDAMADDWELACAGS